MAKHVIFVTGEKGGTGKSFFSRVLLDYCEQNNIPYSAIDTDTTNPTLARFYKTTTTKINIDDKDDLDRIVEHIAKTEGTLILDCGARVMDALMRWMYEVDFFTMTDELGFSISIAFVLGPEKECVTILEDIVDFFEGNASFLVVKNLGKGKDFAMYQTAEVQERLVRKLGAAEIELPSLYHGTTILLDQDNINFADASARLAIVHKHRVLKFRQSIFDALDQAKGTLWTPSNTTSTSCV